MIPEIKLSCKISELGAQKLAWLATNSACEVETLEFEMQDQHFIARIVLHQAAPGSPVSADTYAFLHRVMEVAGFRRQVVGNVDGQTYHLPPAEYVSGAWVGNTAKVVHDYIRRVLQIVGLQGSLTVSRCPTNEDYVFSNLTPVDLLPEISTAMM